METFKYKSVSKLIIIEGKVEGKIGEIDLALILDTGSSCTIIRPEIISSIGYSPKEGIGFSKISSAIGKETGYMIQVNSFIVFDQKFENFIVDCHDLPSSIHVDGLLGMNFLEHFIFTINPSKQEINLKRI